MSDHRVGSALTQVFSRVLGVEVKLLSCEGSMQAYGDIWARRQSRSFAAGWELAKLWNTQDISCLIIGPLNWRLGASPAHLFTAFLRRYYKCMVPVVGFETGASSLSLGLPSDTYTAVSKMSILQLLHSIQQLVAQASPMIGEEAERHVDLMLRYKFDHDLRKMVPDALAASKNFGLPKKPSDAARSLIKKYSDLKLATSFLYVSDNHKHLLPHIYLSGLKKECEAVIRGTLPLIDDKWKERVTKYIGECVSLVESWN